MQTNNRQKLTTSGEWQPNGNTSDSIQHCPQNANSENYRDHNWKYVGLQFIITQEDVKCCIRQLIFVSKIPGRTHYDTADNFFTTQHLKSAQYIKNFLSNLVHHFLYVHQSQFGMYTFMIIKIIQLFGQNWVSTLAAINRNIVIKSKLSESAALHPSLLLQVQSST